MLLVGLLCCYINLLVFYRFIKLYLNFVNMKIKGIKYYCLFYVGVCMVELEIVINFIFNGIR